MFGRNRNLDMRYELQESSVDKEGGKNSCAEKVKDPSF